ncbi:helix-turn-helix transcriptional regulator [Mammaliicoccus sciuri]
MKKSKQLPSSLEWHNVKGAKRERLILERQKRKLTQKELAEKIGVSKSTIGFLETGRSKPGFDVSMALVEFFGIEFEILFPDL